MPKHTPPVRPVLCALLAFATVVSPFHSVVVQAQATPSIVIGEVAWAGSSKSTSDEWLELWNTTNSPISIGGWSLVGAGESNKKIYLPATSTIPALGTFLISNYAGGDAKSTVTAPTDVVTTTVSLSNSSLGIELHDTTGVLVDSAGNGKTPLAGNTSSSTKASMVRVAPLENGSLATSWVSANTSQNMNDSTNLGTPGFCDGCAAFALPEVPPQQTEPEIQPEPDPEQAPVIEVQPDPVVPPEDAQPPAQTVPDTTLGPETAPQQPTIEEPATPAEPAVTPAPEQTPTEPVIVPLDPAPTEQTNTSTEAEPVYVPIVEVSQEPAATTVTSTPDNVPQTTATTPTTNPTNMTTSVPTAPDYASLRLNEIMANPDTGGKEWIEIATTNTEETISLDGCELHDASGRIYTFGDISISSDTPFIVAQLSSSHLNNDGDSVSLFSPDGQLINSFSYETATKGETWIRVPDAIGSWSMSLTTTSGTANVLTQQPAALATTTTAPAASNSPEVAATTNTATTTAPTTPTAAPIVPVIETSPAAPVIAIPKPTTTPTPKTTTSTKPKTTTPKTTTAPKTSSTPKASAPKTSAAKTTAAITDITFDTLMNQPAGIHVKLIGTVGSPPGLLTSHSFILLSNDGRGLSVSVPTSRQLPTFGDMVQLTGTIRFTNNNVPYLSLTTSDNWMVMKHLNPTSPRTVDLIAPSVEDAWSLIQVTGTIDKVGTTSFHLNLHDTSVTVSVPAVVGYRVQRLKVGDTVAVTGIVDTSKEEARVLPRNSQGIILIQNSSPKAAGSIQGNSPLTGWTPFGAAAGAIAVTEGAKQVQKRRKQKLLVQKLSELSAA